MRLFFNELLMVEKRMWGTIQKVFKQAIPSHDVVVLRLIK